MAEQSTLLRQWSMLRVLGARHLGVTVRALADELEVCDKTIRRDLATLQMAGFPIEDTSSALLHRETAVTAFQYPFALNLNDCRPKADWTRALLKAIGELNDVAGNHARSYFEMAPASIVVRLTESLVAGYGTYGFTVSGQHPNQTHNFPEIVDGLLHEEPEMDDEGRPVMETKDGEKVQKMTSLPDYTPSEFYLGGKLVKDMPAEKRDRLEALGVTLERDPRNLLRIVADTALS